MRDASARSKANSDIYSFSGQRSDGDWTSSFRWPKRASQQPASLLGAARIRGRRTAVEVADETFLVHYKRGAARDAEKVQNAVVLRNSLSSVTEQRESSPDFLREPFVGGFCVDADAQNLCPHLFELGDTRLVRLEFTGSGGRVGQDVEHEHHVLLSPKIDQPDLLTVLIGKFEFRRPVADL